MKRKDREKMMFVFKIVAVIIVIAMLLSVLSVGLDIGG
jgi:t-SNARE complex subunit (syntaxin)